MPNCPECVFKKRNVIIEEHKDDEDVNLNQLLDEVEVLMKFDPVTKQKDSVIEYFLPENQLTDHLCVRDDASLFCHLWFGKHLRVFFSRSLVCNFIAGSHPVSIIFILY